MAVNPDSIPRYAAPTQEELEDIFRDPTPGEMLRRCAHCEVCLMWNYTFEGDDETLGRILDCENCEHWSD